MAFGLRGLVLYNSASNPQDPNQMVGVNFTGVAQLPYKANSTVFALQPPIGTLHYREHITKTLYKTNFNSLNELGLLLSKQNDFYTCSAKKYYKFFTGIDVALSDAATTDIEKVHQNKVIELGQKLKTTQNLKLMLYELFMSDAFRTRNYLSEQKK